MSEKPGGHAAEVTAGCVRVASFSGTFGSFDSVYSRGLLHHTGNRCRAFANIVSLLAPSDLLAVASDSDQGRKSRDWRVVKVVYCRTPAVLRPLLFSDVAILFELKGVAVNLVWSQSPRFRRRSAARGMNPRHDWLGGYPCEVATPESASDFFHADGFPLERPTTCRGGFGNNKFTLYLDNRPRDPAPCR